MSFELTFTVSFTNSKTDIKLYVMQNPVDLFKKDLIDIIPRDGMEITFKEAAGHYEELLSWEEN